MYTKPLTHHPIKSDLDPSHELKIVGRLLLAASINSRFCAKLLKNPEDAVQGGFGGEHFHLSESTLKSIATIQAATLPEFIKQLDAALENRLLRSETI